MALEDFESKEYTIGDLKKERKSDYEKLRLYISRRLLCIAKIVVISIGSFEIKISVMIGLAKKNKEGKYARMVHMVLILKKLNWEVKFGHMNSSLWMQCDEIDVSCF